MLNWIPNYREYKDQWIEFSCGFLDFWIEKKLLSISYPTKVDLENILLICSSECIFRTRRKLCYY